MLGNAEENGEHEAKEMVWTPWHDTCDFTWVGTDGHVDGDPPNETDRLRAMHRQLIQLMRDTNAALQVRYERLEAEHDETEIVQDENLMYQLQNQMDEVAHLCYDFWEGWMTHTMVTKSMALCLVTLPKCLIDLMENWIFWVWRHLLIDNVEAGWETFTPTT